MIKSDTLVKGQSLRIELQKVKDRLPSEVFAKLSNYPQGVWMGGFKMVDGNSFGLVLELSDGSTMWFFEDELAEIIL